MKVYSPHQRFTYFIYVRIFYLFNLIFNALLMVLKELTFCILSNLICKTKSLMDIFSNFLNQNRLDLNYFQYIPLNLKSRDIWFSRHPC